MITRLELDGLKAFGRRQEIPIAPITLVFGDNSTGKTSLLQGLLALKQTLESSRAGALEASGRLVDLGGYRNLVHGHDEHRHVRLGLEVSRDALPNPIPAASHRVALTFRRDGDRPAHADEIEYGWASDGKNVSFTAAARSDVRRREGRTLFEASSGTWPPPALREWFGAVLGPRLGVPPAWRFCREAAIAEAGLGMTTSAWDGLEPAALEWALAHLDRRLAAIPQGDAPSAAWLPRRLDSRTAEGGGSLTSVAALDAMLGHTTARVVDALDNVLYLGPARQPPTRVFSADAHDGRSKTGAGLARRLLSDPGLLTTVNEHMRRLEIPYDIRPVWLAAGDPLLEDAAALRLLDRRYPEPLLVNLVDVGFGISQLLPIVVAAVACRGGTVLVEQPELHVHPGLQARLGDVFVREAPATRFLVETHSEHLMLRLLRYVRAGRLRPEDLSVLYVEHDQEGGGANVISIDVDEDGDFIQRWPGGFFTEREDELFDDDASIEDIVAP